MSENKQDNDTWETAERMIGKETIENWRKFGTPPILKSPPPPVLMEIPKLKPWWKFW